MINSQTSDPLESRANPRRYLPDHLWECWQAGEAAAAAEHLRAVLRALLTYLPRHVVQMRLANPIGPAVSGAFTRATLMFADISGFTAMSERLTQLGREGAEVITAIVNDYFAAMLEIIARHGGDLFKFGGDALLVCFGGESSAVRACSAALEMQQAMARFAVIETDQGIFNLRMKVGLGTGTLLLASLGSHERLEPAVLGPALGQMAKAESLAHAGEVLCDRATRDAAGRGILTDERSLGFYRLVGMPSKIRFRGQAEPLEDATDPYRLIQCLDALSPYMPPRVLERVVVSPGQRMIEGQHRLVTVLFANLVGIDEIIAALGPEGAQEITAILNEHFTAMQRVVRRYGGIVNKVDTFAVGYRIMAVFGAPVAHEDDPARAVYAALEMQEAVEDFNRAGGVETSSGRFVLQQRIGVNTGYVFAGNLGSAWRQEYSVMGDEVNLAARLMGAAAESQLLISHSTARHVWELFEWRECDPVNVKGKSRSVRNYRVVRRIAARGGRGAVRGPFFGRQEELGLAQELVDATLAGRGAVLDIVGDPGVGKSRLVAELSVYAGGRGMVTLQGEAVSYGRDIPYLPWIAILHRLFGFWEGQSDGPAGRRKMLVAGLEAVGLAAWSPVVGRVLGIEIPETPLTAALDAQMRQQRFFDVVLQLIQERAKKTPLLLVLDDMQWADAVSLDLVTYVARNTPGSSLLFVIVHRPDLETSPWCADEGCQVLDLMEMKDEDSLSLARSVLGEGDLSPPLCRLILDRAQGNPLFVEEVTRELLESKAIHLEERQEAKLLLAQPSGSEEGAEKVWVLDEAAAGVAVPSTLTGLIMSRLDRLETTDHRLLQVAAVIGVSFRLPRLARVYPYGDLNGTLPGRLDRLAGMELLGFVLPDEYLFKHTLTQEVAYTSLSFARRRELHVRVGDDIEKHHTGDLAEHYGVLARHFDEGRVFDKAFTYLVRAGDKARDEFANEAALHYYQRALQTAGEVEAEAEDGAQAQVLGVLEAMGDVFLLTSRYTEAIERFQEAIAKGAYTAQRCSHLLSKIARAYELQGQYDEALEYLERGRWVLSWDDRDKYSVEMARIFNWSGWVHMRRGEMEAAIRDCEQGLAILTELEREEAALSVEADLNHTLGTVYLDLKGNYSEAARLFQRTTELRQKVGDLPGLARSYNNLAKAAWAQGDLQGAGDYLQRLLEISRKIGNNYFLAFGYNNLGAVSYKAGDVPQALEYYHAALSLQGRIGDSFGVAQSCHNIGEAHYKLGQNAEALRYLERAAVAFEAIHSEAELSEVYRLRAEVELAEGEIDLALEYAERARCIAVATGNLEWQGIAARVLAQGRAERGDLSRARQSFEASIQLLRASESQVELARSHCQYGLLLARKAGLESEACEHLQQAVDLFTAAGAQAEAATVRAALAQLDTENGEPDT